MPAKKFSGGIPGFVFSTRHGFTGYHPDREFALPPIPLILEEAVAPPRPLDVGPSAPGAARHQRRPDGSRVRRKPRRRAPAAGASCQSLESDVCDLADHDWKDLGLWAVDTANPSSWTTAEDRVMGRSAADVVLIQESKRVGETGVAQVVAGGRSIGWNCSASPAKLTELGGPSGGCVVAARRGTGIRAEEGAVPGRIAHRFHVAWVAAVVRAGLHIASIYLRDGVGLDDENLATLHEVAGILRGLRGPWILGGDWNVSPEVLLGSNWLSVVGGVVVAPKTPTCNKHVYDFFVVSEGLLPAVRGVIRVADAGLNPHSPVRLLLSGDGRRHLTRQLVRPLAVPGALPYGPLPQPQDVSHLMPTSVDQVSIDAAAQGWVDAARKEWASLSGDPAEVGPPRFRWGAATGPLAEQHAGATALSALWRSLSRRVVECADVLDKCRPEGLPLVGKHLYKATVAVRSAPFDEADRSVALAWVDAARAHAHELDSLALRKLSAIAAQRASKMERHQKYCKDVAWKNGLAEGGAGSWGSARPSRAAFQWVRGSAGWTRSPVGLVSQNDDVAADDDDPDDCPEHLVDLQGVSGRCWQAPGASPAPLRTVLCDQADVEAEAGGWAKLWREDDQYHLECEPLGTPALEPLMPWALRRSASSFPVGTGKGADNVAPRAYARLSDQLLKCLCAIFMATELLGEWPALVKLVLIVLLPKADGGRRPIGLFASPVRLWARARALAARAWESLHSRPCIFGGSGMGAQRAAWNAGFRAEAAALAGHDFAQTLLDLVKAFETIPHAALVAAARKHGYCLWLLRLSLAAYRLPRTVGVDRCYSRLVTATRGITAGSCFATTELRLLMLDVVDGTFRIWKTIQIALYVDDLTLACSGPACTVAAIVAGATDTAVNLMETALGLEVSVTKSVVAAGRPALARRIARFSETKKVRAARAAKLLGAPAGGGRRRYVRPARDRVLKFATKVKKVKALRRLGVDAGMFMRSAGIPAMLYAVEVTGMSDTHLQGVRKLTAAAVAPDSGGKNPDLVLLAADAAGARTDPAFEAHAAPIKYWATAWWEDWQPKELLISTFDDAAAKLKRATRTVWDRATGPAAGLLATLWRLGWTVLAPTRFLTDEGVLLDVTLDSPAAAATLARASVRRWQLSRAMAHFPDLVPAAFDHAGGPVLGPGVAAGPVAGPLRYLPPLCVSQAAMTMRLPASVHGTVPALGKLLFGKTGRSKEVDAWNRSFRPYLRSAVAGGQWPQARIAQLAGPEADSSCQLCAAAVGTLEHRRHCDATRPDGGWPAPKPQVGRFIDALDEGRRRLLLTRGMLTVRLQVPAPAADGWFRWLKAVPDSVSGELVYYIDGSLLDGPSRLFGRTGFAVVAVDRQGELRGYGHGVPPCWVRTAAAAEAWALYVVLRACPTFPRIITDCLGLVDTLGRGPERAVGAARPLARLWNMIFLTLDWQVPAKEQLDQFIWMPAHGGIGTIGSALKSDGTPVSPTDWRANRLADILAKAAAGIDRTPIETQRVMRLALQATEYAAATLGMVTHASNNARMSKLRPDGTYHLAVCRDACPPAYLNTVGRTLRRKPRPRSSPPAAAAKDQPASDATRAEQLATERAAWAKGARGRAKAAEDDKRAEGDKRFLQAWLKDKAAGTPTPAPDRPDARGRLEAIRRRIAARAASR